MIPTIGIMIATYIFTRMLELIINKQTHKAYPVIIINNFR